MMMSRSRGGRLGFLPQVKSLKRRRRDPSAGKGRCCLFFFFFLLYQFFFFLYQFFFFLCINISFFVFFQFINILETSVYELKASGSSPIQQEIYPVVAFIASLDSVIKSKVDSIEYR